MRYMEVKVYTADFRHQRERPDSGAGLTSSWGMVLLEIATAYS